MSWGQLLTSGVDLWLNTSQKPYEASGISGMKAALNGVPNLSILDGWWIEGCLEGITGWAIGGEGDVGETATEEAASLYAKLAHIATLFYQRHPLLPTACRVSSDHARGDRHKRLIFSYAAHAVAIRCERLLLARLNVLRGSELF